MKNLYISLITVFLFLFNQHAFCQGTYNMCGTSTTTDSSGTLYDSGGPNGLYQVSESCTLLIAPSTPSIITLSFQFFATESNWDFFQVYDGQTTNDPQILNISGTMLPSPVTTSSGYMLIVWHSDFTIVDSGFACTWNTISCPCSPISGRVFNDLNANCLYDASEEITDMPLKATNGQFDLFRNTDSTGIYSFIVPDGFTYDVSLMPAHGYNDRFIPSCPATGSITVSSLPSTGNDFAAVCPDGFDLTGSLAGWGFRPGFQANLFVSGNNLRCITPTGNIEITFLDSNTTPLPDSGNAYTISGNTVSIPISNGEYSWSSLIPVMVSTNSQIGDSVCFQITMNPIQNDSVPGNNIQTFCFPVRNSWDPNEKFVEPAGESTEGFILPDTRLTYTVMFQNTGSADAVNIYILDSLSANLDVSTLEIVSSSHPMTWTMHSGNVLRFDFQDIHLPDSGANEPGSHGFVKYKINPVHNVSQMAEIKNSASIYFDFNPAIYTNTTLNTIDMFLLAENGKYISNSTIFPNPADLTCNLNFHVYKLREVSIYDISGKCVYNNTIVSSFISLDTENLESGIYIVTINDGEKIMNSKLIVDHH